MSQDEVRKLLFCWRVSLYNPNGSVVVTRMIER